MNLEFDNFDYYDTLNVTPNSSQDEIKSSYRKLIRLWHPDKHSIGSESDPPNYGSDNNHQTHRDTQSISKDVQSLSKKRDSAFTKIQKAYSVLSDPILRSHYGRFTTNSYFIYF
uniref:DnaJ protein, putative n=1 Tax=Theileria annulata TaxID=5874 RepID=A0A3B0N1T7_THEAN